jgi:hypothetical protein
MIWNLIGSIGGKVLDIVDDVVEDNDEAKPHFLKQHYNTPLGKRKVTKYVYKVSKALNFNRPYSGIPSKQSRL